MAHSTAAQDTTDAASGRCPAYEFAELCCPEWGGFYYDLDAPCVDVVQQSRRQEIAAMERLHDHLDGGAHGRMCGFVTALAGSCWVGISKSQRAGRGRAPSRSSRNRCDAE